jgi:histidinol-phosphate aminotransferase
VKPWRDPGFETFIRVSVGTPDQNAQFVAALRDMD